mgnify:CR=1 FL=1
MQFTDYFHRATGLPAPFAYQQRLAEQAWPDLLNVPTGLGKTAAVVLAWLYKRRVLGDAHTPRRLVYCLPMRVLVEQTERSVRNWLDRLDISDEAGTGGVGVHLLMGGEADMRSWVDHPEEDAILIGTQDMLLSRALMRGYGMSRYQWPVHFALLHSDALWVYDEVQLMGPGLPTAVQLDALRRRHGSGRPARSLWMSATLNRDWLATVDMRAHLPALAELTLDDAERADPQIAARLGAVKHLQCADVALSADNHKSDAAAYARELCAAVLTAHVAGSNTLVVLNSVVRAQVLFATLEKQAPAADLLLVHARFRPTERRRIEGELCSDPPAAGRIIVATQAIEAGVDISSRTLFTELAPWSSLVQRFGRNNRYGECRAAPAVPADDLFAADERGGSRIFWLDIAAGDDKLAAPYSAQQLDESRRRLLELDSANPADLPATDAAAPLYQVLRDKDLRDLFNTDTDLSGFDIDISAYIRDADEADVQLFWRDLGAGIDDQPPARRDELCRASMSQFTALFKRAKEQIYQRDSLDSDRPWKPLHERARPGMLLMVDAAAGGYLEARGFSPKSKRAVAPVVAAEGGGAAESYPSDPRSFTGAFVSLPQHLCDAEDASVALCDALPLADDERSAITRAARWHDVGKAHAAFQNMLTRHLPESAQGQREGELWAKSDGCGRAVYFTGEVTRDGDKTRYTGRRQHFRHELASALAWLDQHDDEAQADLIAYLIAAHHGKVRMGLRALPGETQPDDVGLLFARGVWAGDRLPGFAIGAREQVVDCELQLDLMQLGEGPQGPSWAARTQRLLAEYGPFRLAWLEALVRIADWRASRNMQEGEQA